jgi:hypothetical protein
MADGVAAYLQSQRDGGLLAKTIYGKLHIQLVYISNHQDPIGFCITSLSSDRIGEVEALYVLDKYQGIEPPSVADAGFPCRLLTRLSPPLDRRYWAVYFTSTSAPTAEGFKYFTCF